MGTPPAAVAPAVHRDPYTAVLADHLAALARAGLDAPATLTAAAAPTHGPLPDDHAAAALWWRITRGLSPAVVADLDHDPTPAAAWTARLADVLGPDRAAAVQASPWWPALVAAVEDGLRRGWRLEDLLTEPTGITAADIDDGQALTWRASILAGPVPVDDDREVGVVAEDSPPDDLSDHLPPPASDAVHLDPPSLVPPGGGAMGPGVPVTTAGAGPDSDDGDVDGVPVEVELAAAAAARGLAGPPEPSDAAIERMVTRAIDAEQSPVSPERIAELNEAAASFYQEAFTDSWGRDYLLDRVGVDLHRHPLYRPGQAPAGWTRLTDHLRGRGVSDAELLAAGMAVTARTGRLIDRFRDRVLFPILAADGTVLAFIGRRRPDHDDTTGPKYLNTADTVLYHKGAQLYGAPRLPGSAAVPVLVEGPLDAIAVTLAGRGRYYGVAPLGTSLTDDQARQLAAVGADPVVATDADLAGQVAADRAYWLLTVHRLDPRHARLPAGSDPADLLTRRGPAALAAALDAARPLADVLLDDRLTLPTDQALPQALDVVAARPAPTWDTGLAQITHRLHVPRPGGPPRPARRGPALDPRPAPGGPAGR